MCIDARLHGLYHPQSLGLGIDVWTKLHLHVRCISAGSLVSLGEEDICLIKLAFARMLVCCWQGAPSAESHPRMKLIQSKAELKKKKKANAWEHYLSSWVQVSLKPDLPWIFHKSALVNPFLCLSRLPLDFLIQLKVYLLTKVPLVFSCEYVRWILSSFNKLKL